MILWTVAVYNYVVTVVCQDLMNNSLISQRGGVGHSELQRYHKVSALNLFRSLCRGAISDLSDKETDCVAVKSKDSVLTVCEVSRLDNNSLLQQGGANTVEGILSLNAALLSSDDCNLWTPPV